MVWWVKYVITHRFMTLILIIVLSYILILTQNLSTIHSSIFILYCTYSMEIIYFAKYHEITV